jgi:hypothetical protein
LGGVSAAWSLSFMDPPLGSLATSVIFLATQINSLAGFRALRLSMRIV